MWSGRVFLLILLGFLCLIGYATGRTLHGHELDETDDDDSTKSSAAIISLADNSTGPVASFEDDYVNATEMEAKDVLDDTVKAADGIEESRLTQVSDSLPPWLQHGRFEFACLVLFVLAAVKAFTGKQNNETIVDAWMRVTRELFEQSFELCVFKDSTLISYGWDYFEFYASGRSNCSYCLVKLQCRRRQCLWQDLIVRHLTRADEDVMDLEIAVTMPEKFSFILGRRMQLKTLQSWNKDLGSSVSIKNSQLLSPALCVLSDDSEVVEKLITEHEANILNANTQSIRHLIISDLAPSERFIPHNKILRLSLALPPQDRMMDIIPFLTMTLRLVDRLASFTLSDQSRHRVKKARESIEKRQLQESEAERREALENKKAEKLRDMNPEERRKREEKLLKKQEKASKPKLKVMKM